MVPFTVVVLVALLALASAGRVRHHMWQPNATTAALSEGAELEVVPMMMYKQDCGLQRPQPVSEVAASLLQSLNPGAGIKGMDDFKPFKTVEKDGFYQVACVQDWMHLYGDKFGSNKHDYLLKGSANVSVVHYDAHVAKEDRQEMTQNVCFEFCRTVPDMLYFGILNGRECYCAPYYKQMASDSSECDATCPGEPTTICGGKSKSSVFEMHFCDSTEQDLNDAAAKATVAASDFDSRVAMAKDLSKSMQDAGAANQETFGKAGDPAASDLMQEAKVFAGELQHAAEDTERISETVKEMVNHAKDLKNFKKVETVTEAEHLMVDMGNGIAEGRESATALGDLLALAAPSKEYIGAADQYYPIMYFVDKQFEDTPQSCKGEMVGKPIVGESLDGCAAACDANVHSCVGFSYFGTGEDPLCFLFSKFKSAVYYSGCESEEKKDALIQTSMHKPVKVERWRCGSVGVPFEMSKGKKNSKLQSLNVGTGEYKLILRIDKTMFKEKIRAGNVNACSINPVDSTLYCAFRIKGKTFLGRMDATKIGLVAQIPKGLYAATFSPDGVYYAYGGKPRLIYLEDVHKLDAFDSSGAVLPDYTDVESFKDEKFGGDIAVMDIDMFGKGNQKFLLSLANKKLTVVSLNPQPVKAWVLDAKGLEDTSGAWGAGYTFRNEVLFGNNKGSGVWQLLLSSIDLKEKTAEFVKVTETAGAGGGNDGFNCMNGRSPFPTVIEIEDAGPELVCLAKLTSFEGTTLKPDPSGRCKQCLKKLTNADRCYK
eukprot:gnl/TRDRNA2_/TRDRNA2_165039_c0_seq7.p1 gnl/TRDRNA2_/TRDRNA2_165039_c0~~gnl/TRDRNA2_/TRDRNA2_165039_c0_seq7.p1  ORF type:complete len:768 (+),score=170.57 gnl/TRDRNA2_/TRDRNA2_165039_c0_seq7:54-2357(+)